MQRLPRYPSFSPFKIGSGQTETAPSLCAFREVASSQQASVLPLVKQEYVSPCFHVTVIKPLGRMSLWVLSGSGWQAPGCWPTPCSQWRALPVQDLGPKWQLLPAHSLVPAAVTVFHCHSCHMVQHLGRYFLTTKEGESINGDYEVLNSLFGGRGVALNHGAREF